KLREFWFGNEVWPEREKSWLEQNVLFSDPRVSANPGVLGVLLNARTITGLNVAFNLRCKVINEGGSYYHFSMSGAFDSPLGWSLSSIARNQLEEMLPANSGDGQDGSRTRAVNTRNMASLINEINGGPPTEPMRKCQ